MVKPTPARIRLFFLLITLFTFSCKGISPLSHTTQATSITKSALSPTEIQLVYSPTPTKPARTATATQPPATPTATVLPATPTPTATRTPTVSAVSTLRQMRVFESLWQVIDDEYLYPDFNGVDWEAVYEEFHARIDAGISFETFYQAMDEMVARLGDDHSVFFSPDETDVELSRFSGTYEYSGIGVIHLVVPERNRLTVILVFPGSPADRAGIQIHDNILMVNGTPILDEYGLPGEMIPGPPGTSVTLTVQTPGGPQHDLVLVREPIKEMVPLPARVLETADHKRIGYILLPTFDDVTVSERFPDVLASLYSSGSLDGLILDNRVNNGGADIVMNEILSYVIDGQIGSYANRKGEAPVVIQGKTLSNSQKIPLVVLVGKNSVSYGEIFAGILQDMARAYLIGEPTDGNVEILSSYSFKDGSSAWIARDIFRPLNHPDQDWEVSGIVPEETVLSEWDQITEETDPVIDAALNYFENMK